MNVSFSSCCSGSFWLTLRNWKQRFESCVFKSPLTYVDRVLQAKVLKVKLLLEAKDYSGAISETGLILKEDESNLEALLLRGRAYYYLADHDVAQRFDK